jgi:hypothetical protein
MMQLIDSLRLAYVSSNSTTVRTMRNLVPAILLLIGVASAAAEDASNSEKPTVRTIGATALVTEVSTGLPLPARVDTGATSCSIHCKKVEIKDADPDPKVNIGKVVRFLIEHSGNEKKAEWIETKIEDYVKVRTAEREDERYKVKLKLRVEDVEKKVLVTLNDREQMKYPLLLGRNFLRDDFLVNVSQGDELAPNQH